MEGVEAILEWSHISFTLKSKDKQTKQLIDRKILDDLNGRIVSGQLLAIMGPTGCGKSSLLTVLAGKVAYNRNIRLEGNIYFNGEFMAKGLKSRRVAYVAQDETLFAFLTVRETLTYATYFHSPPSLSKESREEIVEIVMRELSLIKAADTILGNEQRRGVSGGEYKRVLIGKELIKKPKVILLDEPTSGLDAFQAFAVMETMKKLVERDRIVIAVIHQPRSSIFSLFDRLLLLSDGRLMYFGPASKAMEYFSNLGYVCPSWFNPADYFLDILSIEIKDAEMERESRERIELFTTSWREYEDNNSASLESSKHDKFRRLSSRSEKDADNILVTSSKKNIIFDSSKEAISISPTKPCSSWCSDFQVLISRSSCNIYRNYGGLIVRGVTSIFFAVLVSLIYRNLGNDQKSIQNRAGLLYFVLINQGFSPLIGTLNVIPTEKLVINREVASGGYRYSSYYVGRVLAELPNQIIFACKRILYPLFMGLANVLITLLFVANRHLLYYYLLEHWIVSRCWSIFYFYCRYYFDNIECY
jgi:ABC-type multidrug transport system ATPase subunit